jgi:hypothetical protein
MVVPVGPIEEPLLAEYLIALARDGALRAGLGGTARDFVSTEHSLERSALGYLDIIGTLTGQTIALPAAVPSTATVAGETIETQRQGGSNERNRPTPLDVAPDDILEADPVLDAVAEALTDLRLAGHEPTVRSVAGDLVALGLTGTPREARRSGGWRARWRWARRR